MGDMAPVNSEGGSACGNPGDAIGPDMAAAVPCPAAIIVLRAEGADVTAAGAAAAAAGAGGSRSRSSLSAVNSSARRCRLAAGPSSSCTTRARNCSTCEQTRKRTRKRKDKKQRTGQGQMGAKSAKKRGLHCAQPNLVDLPLLRLCLGAQGSHLTPEKLVLVLQLRKLRNNSLVLRL